MKPFTLLFLLTAGFLCLVDVALRDESHRILIVFTPPLSLLSSFLNLSSLPPLLWYVATILSWMVFGYLIDRILAFGRNTPPPS